MSASVAQVPQGLYGQELSSNRATSPPQRPFTQRIAQLDYLFRVALKGVELDTGAARAL